MMARKWFSIWLSAPTAGSGCSTQSYWRDREGDRGGGREREGEREREGGRE